MVTAKEVLTRAAEMDLEDDAGEYFWRGHGMVRGVKAAVLDLTGSDDVEIYNRAHEPLSLLCAPLTIRKWAADKNVDDRRRVLLALAKELR